MKSKILTRRIQEGGNDILPRYEKSKEKKIIKKPKNIKDKDIYSMLGQFG